MKNWEKLMEFGVSHKNIEEVYKNGNICENGLKLALKVIHRPFTN